MTVCMGYPAMTLTRRAGKRRRKGAGNPCRDNGWTTNKFLKGDEPAAEIVRKVFRLACQGMGVTAIAEQLTEEKVLMQALGVDIQTIQSIVGHADTEMTEHYLHVQESIRQSAIQLFSEAFSAWKLDGTALIRPDKIFGIVVKIVVKTKWGQPANKKIQRFLTWNRWIYGPAELDKSELFSSAASAVKASSKRTVWVPSL